MTPSYDLIIIGTGAGGGTLAHRLAPSGKRILLLERGGYVPREKQNWDSRAVGRPFPADVRANDFVHWQTRLLTDHDALDKLGQACPVAIPGRELGFARGVTGRDPDGHALEMVEP